METTATRVTRAAMYLDSYARSAEVWINAFERFGDAASVRNLGFALGRYDSAYLMVSMLDPALITPERRATRDRFHDLWERATTAAPKDKFTVAANGGIDWAG